MPRVTLADPFSSVGIVHFSIISPKITKINCLFLGSLFCAHPKAFQTEEEQQKQYTHIEIAFFI